MLEKKIYTKHDSLIFGKLGFYLKEDLDVNDIENIARIIERYFLTINEQNEKTPLDKV